MSRERCARTLPEIRFRIREGHEGLPSGEVLSVRESEAPYLCDTERRTLSVDSMEPHANHAQILPTAARMCIRVHNRRRVASQTRQRARAVLLLVIGRPTPFDLPPFSSGVVRPRAGVRCTYSAAPVGEDHVTNGGELGHGGGRFTLKSWRPDLPISAEGLTGRRDHTQSLKSARSR